MKREYLAYPWATPPKLLGPLVILLLVIVVIATITLAGSGRVQEAILACAAGGVLILVAVIDMLAEVVRHQKLILEILSGQRRPGAE